MSNPADRIEDEALQLSIDRRARLARRLLESLDSDGEEAPDAVARAWEVEVERRVHSFRAGTLGPLARAEKVFEEARDRIQSRS